MKGVLHFCLVLTSVATGFSQTLPFPPSAPSLSYQATNFDIAWEVPEQSWPESVWIYKTKRSDFSPESISNLLTMGSFSRSDVHDYGGYGINAYQPGRSLRVSLPNGEITYNASPNYGFVHLTTNLPSISRMVELTETLLPKIGINLSELLQTNGHPIFAYDANPEGMILYPKNGAAVTNLYYREIVFQRVLDGIRYKGIGGDGRIDYGENEAVIVMRIDWHGVERDRSCKTMTKQEILQALHDGSCYFPRWFYFPYQDKIDINWKTVKHLTINQVIPCYWGINYPDDTLPAKSMVYPYADLFADVDTGTTILHIEIVCPIIKESR